MSFPKHIKCVPEDRKAFAPYNFVELPDKVVTVDPESLPSGDRYHSDHHTGTLKCTLTTESPLYTRCGWTPEDFAKYGDKPFHEIPQEIQRKRANFFLDPITQKPAIPGSGIRGMLRTLVEIVSFSKIVRVTNNKLFYRSLGDPALREIYQSNFVESLGKIQESAYPKADGYRSKVRAGFLRMQGNGFLIEECHYGRLDSQFKPNTNKRIFQKLSMSFIYQGSGPGKTPTWELQNKAVYVMMDSEEKNYFFKKKFNQHNRMRHPDLYLRFRKVHEISFQKAPNLKQATLVITGDMQHKHLEFIFLNEKLKEYPVSGQVIKRFQDDDQITKWQGSAFPKNKPSLNNRQNNGYLRDGEPVFFLLDEDNETVRFLGRAQMFRLPYDLSPLDLIPEELRKSSDMDMAEALFGYIDADAPRDKARAGRLIVGNGVLNLGQETKIQNSLRQNPQAILLSSPKPTTFQHYLVQTETKRQDLKHYASSPPKNDGSGETAIRGHKLYWHKPYTEPDMSETSDTQTSLIKPLDKGIKFSFDIRFENLSNAELGVLLWVLSLSSDKSEQLQTGKVSERYCFSLGMGKPLGMGAVTIDYELYLSDRPQRYQNLFESAGWEKAERIATTQEQQNFVNDFEAFILHSEHGISENDHPQGKRATKLREVPRIEMLLAMLQSDTPDERVDYMSLNDFKGRKAPILE
jgi:CRISPR-associated protein (TIGR03986 family)